MPKITLLGIGNELRGDDSFPLHIIETLKKDKVDANLIGGSTPENLLNKITSHILLVDTVDFGGEPGEVRIWDITSQDIDRPHLTTHKAPLRFILDYIKPKRALLVGIQPKDFSSKSRELKEFTEKVVNIIKGILKSF